MEFLVWFAVSNKTSVVFDNYDADQYNSAVGHGYDGSENYAVVYPYGELVEVMNKPEVGDNKRILRYKYGKQCEGLQ